MPRNPGSTMSKRRKSEKSDGATPLAAKAQALAEKQAKLRAEIERNEELIKNAPRLAREQEMKRRDELIRRRSRTDARPGSPVALQDRRYLFELDASRPARVKSLRAERRRGRLLFFALLLTFFGVVYWAYFVFTHQS